LNEFTVGTTGFSGTVTGTAKYQRVGRMVILDLPALSGTSNSAAFTLTGLPAEITPVDAKSVGMMNMTSAGLRVMGSAVVNANGTVTLSAGVLGTVFSVLLGKGIDKVSIAYLV
jgi:hypothetical protein